MKNILLFTIFVLAQLAWAKEGVGQDFRHHHNGAWHSHPHTHYHYHYPTVGYRPVVQCFPSGTWMNVGPVNAYQMNGRRYVRMGINTGFSRYQGYSTFNFRTGETRFYPYRGR